MGHMVDSPPKSTVNLLSLRPFGVRRPVGGTLRIPFDASSTLTLRRGADFALRCGYRRFLASALRAFLGSLIDVCSHSNLTSNTISIGKYQPFPFVVRGFHQQDIPPECVKNFFTC